MKKVSLLLFTALATLSLSAQNAVGYSQEAGRKTAFEPNSGNWFIGAGASATMYFGFQDQHASFFDRMTVNPNFFVGKWFNPYMGARLALQGGKVHTFQGESAEKMYSMTHLNAHVDFMFNVTNYFLNYDEKRFYNFIPTIGMGYERRDAHGAFFKGRGFNGPTLNASLLNTFRISDRLSAYVEVGGYIVESRFDKAKAYEPWTEKTSHWNGIANATAGIVLKVGKVGFSPAAEVDQTQINSLNDQINALKAENAKLSQRPESCPPTVKCPEVSTPTTTVQKTEAYIPNVVFFTIGSAAIQTNQEVGIYNTAEYLKANPNAKVKIVGYADKDTGTASYNLKLSEKRAKAVADQLSKKYGISSSRISTEWKGSSEQPYKENAWNRVAIFFAD